MINTLQLLDDVEFAKAMLEKETLSKSDLVFSLKTLLKMKYYPVAVKFFFQKPFALLLFVILWLHPGSVEIFCLEPKKKQGVQMLSMS